MLSHWKYSTDLSARICTWTQTCAPSLHPRLFPFPFLFWEAIGYNHVSLIGAKQTTRKIQRTCPLPTCPPSPVTQTSFKQRRGYWRLPPRHRFPTSGRGGKNRIYGMTKSTQTKYELKHFCSQKMTDVFNCFNQTLTGLCTLVCVLHWSPHTRPFPLY